MSCRVGASYALNGSSRRPLACARNAINSAGLQGRRKLSTEPIVWEKNKNAFEYPIEDRASV